MYMASGNSDHKRHRGLVSIAFFHLDDCRRKYLFRERANIIVSLHSFLRLGDQAANVEEKRLYEQLVDVMTKPSAPHTNCARSFLDLYRQDRNEADELFKLAANYLKSIST